MSSKGPLHELVPGLNDIAPELPATPIHPRVLELEDGGQTALLFAGFRPVADDATLHRSLQRTVEARLLAELSLTPDTVRALGRRRIGGLDLALFFDVPDADDAVAAFGFRPTSRSDERWRSALPRLRHEAQSYGPGPVEEPARLYHAPAETRDALLDIDRELARDTGDECWGEAPGAPFERLLARMTEAGARGLTPSLAGLRQLEPALLSATVGPLRLLPPLTFQALCDGVGVIAARELGADVQWAVSEPDDDGLAPPPLLRFEKGQHGGHLPVGLALLRWCVMPIRPGESIPSIADWLKDEIGG